MSRPFKVRRHIHSKEFRRDNTFFRNELENFLVLITLIFMWLDTAHSVILLYSPWRAGDWDEVKHKTSQIVQLSTYLYNSRLILRSFAITRKKSGPSFQFVC